MSIPKSLILPALPIKDMIVFPGARVPFVVGRKASVRTLEQAVKVGDHLVLLNQRNTREEEPRHEGLHSIGQRLEHTVGARAAVRGPAARIDARGQLFVLFLVVLGSALLGLDPLLSGSPGLLEGAAEHLGSGL